MDEVKTAGVTIMFRSTYRLAAYYDARRAGGESRELKLQYKVPEFERGGWNYTRADFDRQVAGSVGILHWAHASSDLIPPDVFAAFEEKFSRDFPDLVITRGRYEALSGWVREECQAEPGKAAAVKTVTVSHPGGAADFEFSADDLEVVRRLTLEEVRDDLLVRWASDQLIFDLDWQHGNADAEPDPADCEGLRPVTVTVTCGGLSRAVEVSAAELVLISREKEKPVTDDLVTLWAVDHLRYELRMGTEDLEGDDD